MLTDIGKELRKLRIENDERLLDMAARLEKSPSFISAVEVGKKSPPSGFEEAVISIYRLSLEAAKMLRAAADRSRKAFMLEPNTALGRDTAGLLARRMNTLSDSQLKEIYAILSKEKKPE